MLYSLRVHDCISNNFEFEHSHLIFLPKAKPTRTCVLGHQKARNKETGEVKSRVN